MCSLITRTLRFLIWRAIAQPIAGAFTYRRSLAVRSLCNENAMTPIAIALKSLTPD
ncbi:hypothetical protein ICL16_03480 [Iningainema sp. BLCCT55]|uniref:Uncharacterized protein n=1 Tax=Iningainema tapete BLCC-T55 TaxID=2748662 RepID=A0A8J7CA01_9CYAN|nr:hypothetical protein [Iningainema tapete BLCC-T55]